MNTKLTHTSAAMIAHSGVFAAVKSYDGMVKAIAKHGKARGKPGEEDYNNFVGVAYEVFCEFFFKCPGISDNALVGVRRITDTSRNKYQAGFDFWYEDFSGTPCMLQAKYKSNSAEKFERKAFYTFIDQCDEHNIKKQNRIWFTTASDVGENGIFHFNAASMANRMRVFAREQQENLIDRIPTFWEDFRLALNCARAVPTFTDEYTRRQHQDMMYNVGEPIVLNGGRGRVTCATGGGKTLVIYDLVKAAFSKIDAKLQIIVAPTIALCTQHFNYVKGFGFFAKTGVFPVHFRSGDDPRDDREEAGIDPTTSIESFEFAYSSNSQILVFTTYVSIRKLLEGLGELEIVPDVIFWDEYHHSVKQDLEHRDFMVDLTARANLFFSASVKRGRHMSGDDEEVYGPELCNITYRQLRKAGILVPKVIVKIIVLKDGKQVKIIEKEYSSAELKKEAKRKNFTLKDAVFETAGAIVAHRDMQKTGKANGLLFSKAVAIIKQIEASETLKEMFKGEVHALYAGCSGAKRKEVCDAVRHSTNSIILQHSLLKEGIDVTGFNYLVLSRALELIGIQQSLGRVVRADPEDTRRVESGELSIDDPTGWNKYSATVYMVKHDGMEDFKAFLREMIQKLQFVGLDTEDWSYADIEEERHGTEDESTDWMVDPASIKEIIGAASVAAAVKDACVEADMVEDLAALKSVSTKTKLEMLFKEREAF